MLNTITFGSPKALPPLLIVHGLFGSARNWGVIARRLSDSRQVLAVDLRNHGDSPWCPTHSYPDLATDLGQVLAAFPPADVIGHSMGGKAAMLLAMTVPARVNRLLIADIAPVVYGHSQTPLIQAMRAVPLAGLASRGTAENLLTVPDPATRAFLLQSLDLKSKPPRWRLNLEVLEAEMPRITGWPDTDARSDVPALFLSGSLSPYVLPEHRPAIRARFPAARFAKLAGAGHWLHADKPREFEATIRAFFG